MPGSGEQGEVQDHRGLYVQILQGLLEGEPRDQAAPDHGVAQRQGHTLAAGDGRAPGAAEWIRDRMEFYKRVEPTEPPRDERLVLSDASTPRMRFSSSNGLGMSLPCGRSS